MDQVWQKLQQRRFRPSETEAITGVPGDRQRKWIERHFKDASPDAYYHWRLDSEGAHSRYTWAGVQALALFAEIMDDVGAKVALKALDRTSLSGGLSDFAFDFRRTDDGNDLLMFYPFDRPTEPVTTTTLKNLANHQSFHVWSTRFYLYNFSALQRRLVDAAKTEIRAELLR